MIYSYFRHSTYPRRIWLEAVCSLLLKTLPCAKTGVQEEEMSRSRDSVLSGHFEMVYFAQNALSPAMQLLQTLHWAQSGTAGSGGTTVRNFVSGELTVPGFHPDLMISPVLLKA